MPVNDDAPPIFKGIGAARSFAQLRTYFSRKDFCATWLQLSSADYGKRNCHVPPFLPPCSTFVESAFHNQRLCIIGLM